MLAFVHRMNRRLVVLPYIIAAGSTIYALLMRQKLDRSIRQHAQIVATLSNKDAELSITERKVVEGWVDKVVTAKIDID